MFNFSLRFGSLISVSFNLLFLISLLITFEYVSFVLLVIGRNESVIDLSVFVLGEIDFGLFIGKFPSILGHGTSPFILFNFEILSSSFDSFKDSNG